jgi:serine/threonine protein kinase
VLNQIVSHYRILEKLGGGGMGVVYRAEDLKLKREVALKFLPEEVSRDRAAVERFEREAEAAAAINHPNICTVYDIGEFDGSPYIAMELLEGETLKHKIQGKPLPLDTILDWAIQITDGLDAAHARGIVHRDLKPANLIHHSSWSVEDPRFQIGEASVRTESCGRSYIRTDHDSSADEPRPRNGNACLYVTGASAWRTTGCTNGPVQSRGSDVRNGNQEIPFQGTSTATVVASLIRDTPEAPLQVNPTLPTELGRIIGKALEKDRDIRYQSAADLRGDLKRLKRDADSKPSSCGSGASFVAWDFIRPRTTKAILAFRGRRDHYRDCSNSFLRYASTPVAQSCENYTAHK